MNTFIHHEGSTYIQYSKIKKKKRKKEKSKINISYLPAIAINDKANKLRITRITSCDTI